jgi:hypothetical protein
MESIMTAVYRSRLLNAAFICTAMSATASRLQAEAPDGAVTVSAEFPGANIVVESNEGGEAGRLPSGRGF